jgi:LmbE family N-acetylglucosaminyl deacetylase
MHALGRLGRRGTRRRLRLLGVASLGALLLGMPQSGTRWLELGAGERLLVIAPHPDDETLGAGGLIQAALARGGSVRVVILTAGDGYVPGVAGPDRPARPADYVAYGERRIQEARAALRELAGVHAARARVDVLGFPDSALRPLLSVHWSEREPERSPTTGATDPPYPEALAPDLPYAGASLEAELVRLLGEARPTLVALPDPLDAHPDHRATGLFALRALRRAPDAGAAPAPRILGYLVHWPGWPPGWYGKPAEAVAPESPLELPPSLPARDLPRVALPLAPDHVLGKRRALARYETQRSSDVFLLAFARPTEPFVLFDARSLRAAWLTDLYLQTVKTPGAPPPVSLR